MKKARSFGAFVALVGLWLVPVTAPAAELSGGLKIGFTLTDIHGSDVRDFPYYDDPDTSWFLRPGFCGGGFATVDLSENAAIQAEAWIVTKGSEQLGIYDVYSIRTTYLEIPLLMKLVSMPGRSVASLFAGPALGRSSSAAARQTMGSRYPSRDSSQRIGGSCSASIGLSSPGLLSIYAIRKGWASSSRWTGSP